MIAFYTIARKEVTRIFRIWMQTLVPPVITMTLYFVIFGRFIGSQINDIQGFTYIQFIVPGLIMMSIIMNSYSNVVSSFFGNKFQKCIEEILVSPTSESTIILGFMMGGLTRGLIVGFLVSIVALFFTQITIFNIFVVIAMAILTSAVFSLAGMINGIFAKKFDDVAIVPTFILTPLTYLSGIFYSIDLLPVFWQNLSKLNPILYMINGFRYGFLGISDINIVYSFAILLVFLVILFGANLILIKKGVGLRS